MISTNLEVIWEMSAETFFLSQWGRGKLLRSGKTMKKVLLGSTALIAAATLVSGDAAASEPIKLSVGGFFDNLLLVADFSDDTGTGGARDGFHQLENAEVQFTGSTKLDNGISIALNIQFEAESANTGDTTDEAYVEISSDTMGKLLLGSENLPDYKMHYGAPSVSYMGFSSTPAAGTFIAPDPTGSGSNNNPIVGGTGGRFNANDPQHVAYYSPRISGFQLGIGYAPDTSQGNAFGATYQNGVSAGLNYQGDFDDFGVNASVGVLNWSETPSVTGSGAPAAVDGDATMFRAGLNFTYAGFTVGGSFADYNNNNGAATSNARRSMDGDAWDLGASYKTGLWAVSAGFAHHEMVGVMNTANAGDDELSIVDASGTYSLGPGVGLVAGFQRAEFEGDSVGEADDRTALFGWLGISLGF